MKVIKMMKLIQGPLKRTVVRRVYYGYRAVDTEDRGTIIPTCFRLSSSVEL